MDALTSKSYQGQEGAPITAGNQNNEGLRGKGDCQQRYSSEKWEKFGRKDISVGLLKMSGTQ